MRHELNSTDVFDDWLGGLDRAIRKRLASRLFQVECGNFGDHKTLAANLFELRCFFGDGLRLLLHGARQSYRVAFGRR
ncbi:type II toxin-antitoxin system RelE/ParE family toxin [Verminephrobacter eiseniae]|uniref:hypothetical protein n=1 Tax=Verminephrobacter eiseniae TaxID=364317 RepID=UPI0022386D86|nr:hypothetical protein [Verminephrobacter eiseniae]